jgi:serine/threonine protein kinase
MTDRLPAGTVIAGRYELGEVLGAGGAGRVYAAIDRRLRRPVAIKLVSNEQAQSADPASAARFADEARTGARFTHPNAIVVYDAGTSDGYLFLVTELVDGTNVAEHLATHGPSRVEEAIGIAEQVLAALAAAHAAGIVHRDVKPSNVLLDRAGNAKLADFGIAKRLDDLETSLTADGFFVGTPRYASPEQAAGMPATAATDVYAVGVLLFEMLTGRAPYEGTDPAVVAHAHRTVPVPDVRLLRPEVPTEVVDVVERALSKAPDGRYRDASEMGDALRMARRSARTGTRAYPVNHLAAAEMSQAPGISPNERLTELAGEDSPDERLRRNRWLLAGAAVLLVAILTAAAVLADRDRSSQGTGQGSTSNDRPSVEGRSATPAGAPPATTTVRRSTTVPTTQPATTVTTTTLPATTTPLTTAALAPPLLSEPVDLIELIAYVEQNAGTDPVLSDLLDDLEKVAERHGNEQRDTAHRTAEKTYAWYLDGRLDPVTADYAMAILNDIIERGNGRGRDGGDDGNGDGGDGGDDDD